MTTTNPNANPISIPTTNATATAAVVDASAGLGALVWWSLTDTRIAPDRLRAILSAEGVDPTIVPDIDQESAVKRATRDWTQGRGKADRFRAEVASTDANGVMTIGVLRREQVSADEVRWVQMDRVAFDSRAAAWLSTGSTGEASSFVAAADEGRTHLDHQWIRPNVILAGLVRAQAVSLRDRGGVYYVPKQYDGELVKLIRIVAAIGRCHLDVIHAMATPASQSSIATGATATLRDDLGALMERIGAWSDSTRRVSESSAATVLGELADLKARAELYQDALQVSLSDLTDAIDEAKAEARRVLSGGEATPTAPARRKCEPSEDVVAGLRKAMARVTPEANGDFWIENAIASECGLNVTNAYHYWRFGIGNASAAALGFLSGHRTTKGEFTHLQLSPLRTVPETTSNESVEAAGSPVAAPVEGSTGSEPVAVVEAVVEAPAVPVVEADEPEAIAVVEVEETAANAREALAARSPAEVREVFAKTFGRAPAARATKAQMIADIVQSIA